VTGAATDMARYGATDMARYARVRRADRRRYQEALLQREIRRLKGQLRRAPGLLAAELARGPLSELGARAPEIADDEAS
jgi:hypothetical protein